MADLSPVVSYIGARMKEPSTWVGLSSILVAFKVLPDDPTAVQALTTAGIAIGGILGAIFPEQGAKK